MNLFDLILWPLRWAIELILVAWHQLFTAVGLDPDGGLTWVLSIVGLVVVVRSALIPLFVRQIKSQRRMMEIAPQIQKIQEKYRGKKDQFSNEAKTREMMALYKENGTSPFASCMPLLIQMPIFLALFRVLSDASKQLEGIGLMTTAFAESFARATIFGAPLRATFLESLDSGPTSVIVIASVLVVLMIASQFYTQLQITSQNISDATKESPMYRQQKVLLYIIPFMFLFSGVSFPLALNIYWFTSNLWAMVQQAIIIRQLPNPGSEAWRKQQERLKKRGKLTEVEQADGQNAATQKAQRQQPMGKKRAKKSGK